MASDYFAALMRASGLAAPAAAPPGAGRRAVADGIVEEQVLQSASPATDTLSAPASPAAVQPEATLSARGPAMPPAAEALPVGPQATLPLPAAGPSAPAARAHDVGPTLPQPRSVGSPESAAPDESRELQPTPPARAPEGREELGQALVRVALNWVQGAARQGAADELAPVPDGSRAPAPAASATPAPPPARAVPPAAAAARRMPALPEAPRAWVVDAAAPPADVATRAGSSAPRSGSVPDTLEISIGAIHLRVDAPPVQAVLPPPTLATPGAATRAAPPKRGDFERRALRRL